MAETTKDYFFVACFILIFVIGVIGNLLVIYIFKFKHRSHNGPFEVIVTYLALTDLVASIFDPFLYIFWHLRGYHAWVFGGFLCTLLPSIQTVSVTASIGLILLITIERCRVLTNPFNRMFSQKRVRSIIYLVFILSILNELPYIVHQRLWKHCHVTHPCQTPFEHPGTCQDYQASILNSTITRALYNKNTTSDHQTNAPAQHCKTEKSTFHDKATCLAINSPGYNLSRLATLILRDLVFAITFIASNYLIYVSFDKDIAILGGQNRFNPKKTFKMLVAMALVFSVLVFPKDIFNIVYILRTLTGRAHHPHAFTINAGLKLLQSSNSIANIFIYSKLHQSFKKSLAETFSFVFIRSDSRLSTTKSINGEHTTQFRISSSGTEEYAYERTLLKNKLTSQEIIEPVLCVCTDHKSLRKNRNRCCHF